MELDLALVSGPFKLYGISFGMGVSLQKIYGIGFRLWCFLFKDMELVWLWEGSLPSNDMELVWLWCFPLKDLELVWV